MFWHQAGLGLNTGALINPVTLNFLLNLPGPQFHFEIEGVNIQKVGQQYKVEPYKVVNI